MKSVNECLGNLWYFCAYCRLVNWSNRAFPQSASRKLFCDGGACPVGVRLPLGRCTALRCLQTLELCQICQSFVLLPFWNPISASRFRPTTCNQLPCTRLGVRQHNTLILDSSQPWPLDQLSTLALGSHADHSRHQTRPVQRLGSGCSSATNPTRADLALSLLLGTLQLHRPFDPVASPSVGPSPYRPLHSTL